MNAPVQDLVDEIKRLRRVNAQQAASWKSCSERLRDASVQLADADIYIKVLEHENEMFQQQISDLQNGGDTQ